MGCRTFQDKPRRNLEGIGCFGTAGLAGGSSLLLFQIVHGTRSVQGDHIVWLALRPWQAEGKVTPN